MDINNLLTEMIKKTLFENHRLGETRAKNT